MSLLYAIESCLRVTKQPPSRFGRESVRDPRLVHDLRRGRQPGPAMERRVRAYIEHTLAKVREAEDPPAEKLRETNNRKEGER